MTASSPESGHRPLFLDTAAAAEPAAPAVRLAPAIRYGPALVAAVVVAIAARWLARGGNDRARTGGRTFRRPQRIHRSAAFHQLERRPGQRLLAIAGYLSEALAVTERFLRLEPLSSIARQR